MAFIDIQAEEGSGNDVLDEVEDAVHQLESCDACHLSAMSSHHISATSPDLTLCVVLSEP